MSEVVDGRRAVGARNAEAILDAAVRVLGADPHAGMGEIAAEAGVGRATLYRHHESREQLIEALFAHVADGLREALTVLEDDTLAPEDALTRYVEAQLALRDRYRGVLTPFITPEHLARSGEIMRGPVTAWGRRAAAAGVVDGALAPTWLVASLRAQVRAAGEELDAGRLRRGEAAALIVRALLRGAAPA